MTDTSPQEGREKLLPCPFCGGTSVELRGNGIGDVYAICYDDDPSEMSCGASTSDRHCETDQGAIRRWNSRALLPNAKGDGGEEEGLTRSRDLSHAASAVTSEKSHTPGPLKCPHCRCSTFAKVDEPTLDGGWDNTKVIRCVECKRNYAAPPASSRDEPLTRAGAGASGEGPAASPSAAPLSARPDGRPYGDTPWRRFGDERPSYDGWGERHLLTWNTRVATYDIGCIDGQWTAGEAIDGHPDDLWRWLDGNPAAPLPHSDSLASKPRLDGEREG